MSLPIVVSLCPLPHQYRERLLANHTFKFVEIKSQDLSVLHGELGARIDSVQGLIVSARDGAAADLLRIFPSMKIVACHGVGVDAIDLAHCKSRGIAVTNTPDVLTESVADLAFGLILAASRRIPLADAYVRSGAWVGRAATAQPSAATATTTLPVGTGESVSATSTDPVTAADPTISTAAAAASGGFGVRPFPLGRSVAHKTLGIIGMGRIGRAIARRAAAFRMRILYTNRVGTGHGSAPADRTGAVTVTNTEDASAAGSDAVGPVASAPVASSDTGTGTDIDTDVGAPCHRIVSLLELARLSDIMVVCCPGGAATHHIVNAAVLDALGPAGLLVNVARGSCVDTAALVQALKSRRLGAAALDVFESEPCAPDELILLPESTVLTPHIGTATVETRDAIAELVVGNIEAYFAQQPLPTPVLLPTASC